MKVVQHGYIIIPPEMLASSIRALETHIQETRKERGCLVFEVKARKAQTNVFDVYEEFEDAQAFEFHQSRTKNTEWSELSKSFERHYVVQHTLEP